ncbi:Protein T05H4.3 [Aphelenchoides avenae]|nr:Protein T05H4.3 [Aphelenchus avenae]
MHAAAAQIATVNSLKSRYYKYLETLCSANGIDIGTLKTNGGDYDLLELFFGGLPVLIGLKYFDKLRVLRLFGQDIVNVKPLSEIAGTLEELWICEGPLKDIAGLEACKQLQKLYLYDCNIENGAAIGRLKSLDTLWVSNNKLRDLSFLDTLAHLTQLKVGGSQFTDTLAMSVERWSPKLQHLDVAGNRLRSFQCLLPLASCEVVRCLNVVSGGYPPSILIQNEYQYGWLAYHFPYLERLNEDVVNERFALAYVVIAESNLLDESNRAYKADKAYWATKERIERNAVRIQEQLNSLHAALAKAALTVTKKEGRRDMVVMLQEQSQKESALRFEYALHKLENYYKRTWTLEGAHASIPRDIDASEAQLVEYCVKWHCTKGDEFTFRLRYTMCFYDFIVDKKLVDQLFFVDVASECFNWDLRSVVEICDRRESNDYRQEPVRIFKDIAIMICLFEVKRSGHLELEDFLDILVFEEKINSQVQKMKDVGVELRLEKVEKGTHTTKGDKEESKEEKDGDKEEAKKHVKSHKVEDCVTEDTMARYRWRKHTPFSAGRLLTLRNPLELTLSFTRSQAFDKSDFLATVTCLDLSEMKLTKLEGIENMNNLTCLSLSSNKIGSVKKLKTLKNLHFLDLCDNQLSKIDDLPTMITDLRLAHNSLVSLGFCEHLQLLTKLDVTHNKVKSLKGLESTKMLETLLAAENNIKETSEIDTLGNFPKLTVLDLSENPVALADAYRKRVLFICPALLSIDHEKVPLEERCMVVRKAGKVLTFEFIEKLYPNYEYLRQLDLSKNEFCQVAMDRTSTSKLQHIEDINLSHNELSHVHELVDLNSLTCLNLSYNSITSLYAGPIDAAASSGTEILVNLDTLDLSYNGLTAQTLPRVGLQLLPKLRVLKLRGNPLGRMDCAVFDLKSLEELDLNDCDVKSIRRKPLPQLKSLNLSKNKLKDIEGLAAPKLQKIDLTNNKIATCAAIKLIGQMADLKEMNCAGNPVTERRVYTDFIKNQAKTLETLDEVPVSSIQTVIGEVKAKPAPSSRRVLEPLPSSPGITIRRSASSSSQLFPEE